MGKSSYTSRIAAAAMIALGYLASPNSAYSQSTNSQKVPAVSQQTERRQNRIYSKNEENSATGDGVLLKDFVYNINLTPSSKLNAVTLEPNSQISLDNIFGLYAQKGNVSYQVVGARKGLMRVLSELRKNKNPTGKERASINYIEGLLKSTSQNDSASVNALERAVQDKIIDTKTETRNIESGRYVFIAKSKAISGYEANSIPIIVDIKNSSYSPSHASAKSAPVVKKNVPAKTQSAKDNAAKDNIAKEKTLRENLASEKHKLDSLKQVEKDRAEKARMKSSADSLRKEIMRVADSTLAAKRASIRERQIADSTAEFVRDSLAKLPAIAPLEQWRIASTKAVRDKLVADSTEKANKPRTRFGVEAAYSSNNEGLVGALIEIPVGYRVDLEIFGNYFVAKGKSDSLKVKADTTLRDRQLIGPGTYKQRTDEIITSSRNQAKFETGLGLLLNVDNVRLNFRGGVGMSSQEEDVEGKSTISFERNALPLGNPETITNSKPSTKKSITQPIFSAGVLYNVNEKFSVGASVNKFAKRSGGRINFRVRF